MKAFLGLLTAFVFIILAFFTILAFSLASKNVKDPALKESKPVVSEPKVIVKHEEPKVITKPLSKIGIGDDSIEAKSLANIIKWAYSLGYGHGRNGTQKRLK